MLGWLYRLGDRARHAARRRRWTHDQAMGRWGEDLAHRYLQRQGYVVVARNYRPSYGSGDIDLVAWERSTLVFVEVKWRASEEFGPPDRAVDPEKQRHLLKAGRDYARQAGVGWDTVRFDIVSILFTDAPSVRLIRDAFAATPTL